MSKTRACKTYRDPHDPPRARVGEYTPDQCRMCWHEVNSTAWWKGEGVLPPSTPGPAECALKGDQVGDMLCKTCRGRVKLKVFRCNHPDQPLGSVVCAKFGCDPSCSGFVKKPN